MVEKLRDLNFSPIFLTSERTNMNQLRNMTKTEVSKFRTVIKRAKGIYRKRVAGTKQESLNKKIGAIVDAADTSKLAKMLRLL